MADKELEENSYIKRVPFKNVYISQGESDFSVIKEEGFVKYTVNRNGAPDSTNPEILEKTEEHLFQGNILDCEAYLRLYNAHMLKSTLDES